MKMASPEMVDRMAVDYFMWHTYVEGGLCVAGEPVRLPRGELEELAALSERMSGLLQKTIDVVLEERALLDWYGFPAAVREMISAEISSSPLVLARHDAFRTTRGWMFAESNCDVPGGIHEASALNDLVLGDPSRFRVVPLLTEALCAERARLAVAVCYASGYGEDLEQCQFLRGAWNRMGLSAVLCNPENLTYDGGGLRAFGERIDAVYRFFPGEWMAEIDNIDQILAAARAGRLRMINGFSALIAQSKKTMALWHERPDLFAGEDRRFIEAHVPRTEAFRPSEIARYRRDRERLVVKRQFGRVGEEVLMGCFCSDEEWADWLDWPASEPHEWIVQERFENRPVEVGDRRLVGCFGPYVVSGRFAGYYTRLAGDGFITHDALVAAVAEA